MWGTGGDCVYWLGPLGIVQAEEAGEDRNNERKHDDGKYIAKRSHDSSGQYQAFWRFFVPVQVR